MSNPFFMPPPPLFREASQVLRNVLQNAPVAEIRETCDAILQNLWQKLRLSTQEDLAMQEKILLRLSERVAALEERFAKQQSA